MRARDSAQDVRNLHHSVTIGAFPTGGAVSTLGHDRTPPLALEVLMRRIALALIAVATVSMAACISPTAPSRADGVTESSGH